MFIKKSDTEKWNPISRSHFNQIVKNKLNPAQREVGYAIYSHFNKDKKNFLLNDVSEEVILSKSTVCPHVQTYKSKNLILKDDYGWVSLIPTWYS